MTIKNSAYKLENIDSSKIITPVSLYQRKTDTARVADIAANFDERIANEPKVSFRDGNYFVFDGQHTVMARIKCNGGKHLPILCKVYYDLSAEDEAKLFATQTGFSSNLTSGERLRAKAYANDQTTVNFIKANESLGVDVSLNRLQSEDMQKYILSLKIGGLSNKSVRDILSVVSAIFKYAENKGFNTNNLYFENLYPKSEKKQIKLLSADERIRLEKRIIKSKNPSEYGILLALYSGMRIGEICALKWENIDLKAGTISVCQTLQRLQDKENKGETKILITEPKSQSSKRIIPIPAFLSALLKQIKPKNPCAFFLTGDKYFTEPRTLDNIFKKCLSDCDIQRINFHALRHTFATRCVEAGFDIKTLSEILGHSNVSTTLNLYAHPTLEHKRANMNKLVPFE